MRYLLTLVFALLLFSGCDLLSPLTFDANIQAESTGINTDKYICLLTPPEVPSLIDGYQALIAKVRYPETAKEIEGRVILTFTVSTEGIPTDIKVAKGLGPEFDAEALRVVTSARFTPGKKYGKVSPSPMAMPVLFIPPSKAGQ